MIGDEPLKTSCLRRRWSWRRTTIGMGLIAMTMGCVSVLQRRELSNKLDSEFGDWVYLGTSRGLHRLRYTAGLNPPKRYLIPTQALPMDRTFPYPAESEDWESVFARRDAAGRLQYGIDFLPDAREAVDGLQKKRTEYYASGILKAEKEYRNDGEEWLPHGRWVEWYDVPFEDLKEAATYEKGELHGWRYRNVKPVQGGSWHVLELWSRGCPVGVWRRWSTPNSNGLNQIRVYSGGREASERKSIGMGALKMTAEEVALLREAASEVGVDARVDWTPAATPDGGG